ncbi:MAG: RnfH family protein [Pseudomonadota bacterium]
MISVEIAYARPDRQFLQTVDVLPNATIEDAIRTSNILNQFPEIHLDNISVGIFSKKATLNTRLSDGDRVEIYRPLLIDPKQARRQRVR